MKTKVNIPYVTFVYFGYPPYDF